VTISRKIAGRLAETRFGYRALSEEADLSVFRARPSPRTCLGLFLIALSYLLGLSGMALFGHLSYQQGDPLVLLIGGGAVMVVIHLIFAAGVYLAGKNYARVLLLWSVGKFLKKHLPPA